ncbi:Protein FAR1-RELATED SEQUENCE 5 [Bienertia sinuspersici]
MSNAIEKSNEDFKDMFKNALMGCDDEEEFEELWAEMMEKYGHQKPEWFNQVYEETHKWCTALNRDIFSASILSSQRSEVTNKAISFTAKATTNLFEFYHIFERTVKRWRSNETSDNFRNGIERPKAINSTSKLLSMLQKFTHYPFSMTVIQNTNGQWHLQLDPLKQKA